MFCEYLDICYALVYSSGLNYLRMDAPLLSLIFIIIFTLEIDNHEFHINF